MKFNPVVLPLAMRPNISFEPPPTPVQLEDRLSAAISYVFSEGYNLFRECGEPAVCAFYMCAHFTLLRAHYRERHSEKTLVTY